MNKQELIEKLTKTSKSSKAEVSRLLDSFVATVTQALRKGEEVVITGFGTFKSKKRAKRTGVNPKTGEKIDIPAMKVARFKPGKTLKDSLKK